MTFFFILSFSYEYSLGLLTGGRSYEIKSKTNAPEKFTIRNELFNVGKKLILLENNQERYTVSSISSPSK